MPWNMKYMFCRQNSNRLMMWLTVIDILCWRSLSFVNLSLMVLMAGTFGTNVKSALTSYDMMYSSCQSLVPVMCCLKSPVLRTWCGDFPTRIFRILANSFAVPWVTVPLLETMGLREFITVYGKYEFQGVPFGIHIAPSYFTLMIMKLQKA